MEVIGTSPLSRLSAPSDVDLELRPLPSTGITRLPRYYEPVRHPTRPGLSLAGVRLGGTHSHRWGFPCCVPSPLQTCRRHYPGGIVGDRFSGVTPSSPTTAAFPVYCAGRLPHFGLSRPAQRSLTLRPACSLSRQKRPVASKAPTISLPPSPLRLLPAGTTSCRAGFAPAEDPRLCTAHTGNRRKGLGAARCQRRTAAVAVATAFRDALRCR